MECWREHPAPIKTGKTITIACVNWVLDFLPDYTDLEEKRNILCKKFIGMGPILPEISLKYMNTLAYFDSCTKKQK